MEIIASPLQYTTSASTDDTKNDRRETNQASYTGIPVLLLCPIPLILLPPLYLFFYLRRCTHTKITSILSTFSIKVLL